MAGFTNTQWLKINDELYRHPTRYELPIHRNKSVVIGSFNSLKLGSDTNLAVHGLARRQQLTCCMPRSPRRPVDLSPGCRFVSYWKMHFASA